MEYFLFISVCVHLNIQHAAVILWALFLEEGPVIHIQECVIANAWLPAETVTSVRYENVYSRMNI